MKTIKLILVLTITLLIHSCDDKVKIDNKPDRDPKSIQSCEVIYKDTVNRINFAGEKQGHWIVTKFVACTKTIQAVYTGETGTHTKVSNDVEVVKVEEGFYIDNKKQGLWRTFYPSGKLKDSILYKDNIPVK